jgi:hypothetical protein
VRVQGRVPGPHCLAGHRPARQGPAAATAVKGQQRRAWCACSGPSPRASPPRWPSPGTSGTCCCYSGERAAEEGLVCVFRGCVPGPHCLAGHRPARQGPAAATAVTGQQRRAWCACSGPSPRASPPRWPSPGTSGTCYCYSGDRTAEEGMLCVFGAESRGLTASLAIARHVRDLLLERRQWRVSRLTCSDHAGARISVLLRLSLQ